MAMYSRPASRAARAIVHGVGAAVGGRRVHVQVAAQVLERDQPRQRAGLGRLDLAAILAQFRRDERQAERLVDAFLGLAGHERTVVHPVEAVFVQLEAALDGAVAKRDVVALRAGEVLERRAARWSAGTRRRSA